MSLSAIWDRFWWSLMLGILVGLLWLKFLDPVIPCVSAGIIVSVTVGAANFYIGMRKMVREYKAGLEVERRAYEELLAEMQMELADD